MLMMVMFAMMLPIIRKSPPRSLTRGLHMVSRAGAEEHGMLCRAACRKAAVTKATTEVCHCCTELKSVLLVSCVAPACKSVADS